MAKSMQEQADEFYLHVGASITQWAEIDELLFKICWKSLGSSQQRASIVYYRTPGLEVRLSLTDELVVSVLPQKDRPNGGHDHASVVAWRKLVAKIKGLQPTRNRLAHQPSILWMDSTISDPLERPVQGFALYMSASEQQRGRSVPPLLKIPELKQHYRDVLEVRDGLFNFYNETLLKRLEELQQQSPQQSKDPNQG